MQVLWNLAHALEVRSKQMAKQLGVTGPQRLVIRVLGQAGELAPGQLATVLGMHPSTLTGILARLQDRDLIRRVPDPLDARRAHVSLSPLGRIINRTKRGTVEAAVARALARTSPDSMHRTRELLEMLVAELERE